MVRLVYINEVNGEKYTKAVLSQQAYSSKIIPAKRGDITDRNGIVLARSEKIYNVVLDPKVILSKEYYYEPTMKSLVESLGYDEQEMKELIKNNSKSSYLVYEKNIDYSRVSEYNKYKSSHKHVVGVWFEEEFTRVYPYSTFASHVIGFTNKDGGSNGLEHYYNELLTGTEGMKYGYFDSELNQKDVEKDAVNGRTIVSTIDYNIQSVVEKKIKEFREQYECNNIGVIVMNPNNGEVYAMASNDEFDLNNPHSLDLWYTKEELEAMDNDAKVDALYKRWRNFCISDTYEPGSTFKPITVASALEENLVNSGNTFYCPGVLDVSGWPIHCNDEHGWLTLTESLMKSCNCAMMDIVSRLGRDDFYKYQRAFGFGRPTGIDITGETSGIIIDKSKLNVTELATSSFGTTFNVSMIQMASAYCSLVNGGTYYTPHLVKEIKTDEGTTIESFDNLEVRQTISKKTSDYIRGALLKTVQSGTGRPAQIEGYEVGGKTGTAQKRPRTEKKFVVSFAGFAPVDNPQLLMYVVIDDIHDSTLYNSSRPASSMTSAVFKEILPYLGEYPEGQIDYIVDEELLRVLDETTSSYDEENPGVLPEELEYDEQ
ncbi:MAG: peptidoglycan glycosyltransferase [Lachnospiraceae bacterium]|nr:peptidoglycan glycosyltransferase [Lachnospiraceae bacterium]